jgi:hypothetical protein
MLQNRRQRSIFAGTGQKDSGIKQNHFRIMKKTSLLIILWLCFSNLTAQKISFFAEDLQFFLNDSIFEVDGLYYFRNTTGVYHEQILFYPFPDTEEFGEIGFIKIKSAGDTSLIKVTQTNKGAMFMVQLEPAEEKIYKINYSQKLRSKKAKYIITTTQKWKSPFDFANYSLCFPATIEMESVSILPDKTEEKDGKVIYTWKKNNFMPEADFIFEFR